MASATSNQFAELPIPDLCGVGGWQQVSIIEGNEPFVDLSQVSWPGLVVRPMYRKRGITGAIKECYVRRTVADMLQAACNLLPSGFCLVIADAWRPVRVQEGLYEAFQARLLRKHPDWPEEKLNDETAKFVSKPSTDLLRPSPHLTGGAIDILLGRENQQLANMGTRFDAFNPIARTRYFERALQSRQLLTQNEHEALANRRVLFHVLTSVGFTNYPEEWWHYDFGDQFWARISGRKAQYGPCLAPWEAIITAGVDAFTTSEVS